jgi:serine phosphatase RsbU (regulator of sigma subunit)
MTSSLETSGSPSIELTEHWELRHVRSTLAAWLEERGLSDLLDDAGLVLSELVTNALLHGGSWAQVTFHEIADGIRIEVADRSDAGPVVGWSSDRSMTGRGIEMVRALAHDWGVTSSGGGKLVWAELSRGDRPTRDLSTPPPLPRRTHAGEGAATRYLVSIGDIPTELLLDAKSHVDNLVREFTLAASGAQSGQSAEVPAHLAALIEAVVNNFSEARGAIKRQALAAARSGASHTHLELELTADAAAAGEEYLRALDEADAYCRAMRLLTLETPPQHKVFRQWYIGELVTQLRAAAAGEEAPPPESFEHRILRELDRVAAAQRASDRAARLFAVTRALAAASTPEEVAQAVLSEGVIALRASAGGLLLTSGNGITVPGAVGYADAVTARFRSESPDEELPAAVALRTGEPVWIESREEKDRRFPELATLEPTTVAICAIPLVAGDECLGALRFSFTEPRLFHEDEQRFALALAAQAAQALDRAQLQSARDEIGRRLQRGLLPPDVPTIPDLDVAAVYEPFGKGVEVGGDFYDVWPLGRTRWAFAIGDVAGTGPEAASVTGQVRHTLRALTVSNIDPGSVLRRLNAALLAPGGTISVEERFCSAILCIADIGEDGVTLRIANAGHPYPLRRAPDGSVGEIEVSGQVLGAVPAISVDTHEVVLEPGATVVLFTDGLIEARGDAGFFEVSRALDVLARTQGDAATTAAALKQAVVEHRGGALSDDVAILVLRAAPAHR